jgi:hypothetical protein
VLPIVNIGSTTLLFRSLPMQNAQDSVGFDNRKQGVFDLVQVLKMLFLHTQSKKETSKDYGRNF